MRDKTADVFCAAFLFCGICCALPFGANRALAAGGAYAVDDTEIGKPGDCKVESWLSVATNATNDLIATTSPACVVKLGIPIEVGGQFQRTRTSDEWGTTGGWNAKANLLPAEPGKIGLAVSGGMNFDLLTHQTSSYFVNVPVTFQILENFKVNINGGYLHELKGSLDWATWGGGFEWEFIKQVTLISEIYGQLGRLPQAEEDEAPTPEAIRRIRTQTGLRFTPMESVDLDFIYGHNITGENAHWFTLGLNVRFSAK